MISPSGKCINGKWIPTNPPQIDPPPSPTPMVGRGSYASKTTKLGTKEAIKTAFEAGNTTINEIREEIFTEGFELSKSSINAIMREQKIGTRYKKRANKNASTNKTCKPKKECEDRK